MAVYQFVIELIPSEWVAKNKTEAIELLRNDLMEHDTSVTWESFSLPSKFDSLVAERKVSSLDLRLAANLKSQV